MLFQQTSTTMAGELAFCIGVEDVRLAIPVDRLLYSVHAELGGQRIRQSPHQPPAACPAHGEGIANRMNVFDALPVLVVMLRGKARRSKAVLVHRYQEIEYVTLVDRQSYVGRSRRFIVRIPSVVIPIDLPEIVGELNDAQFDEPQRERWLQGSTIRARACPRNGCRRRLDSLPSPILVTEPSETRPCQYLILARHDYRIVGVVPGMPVDLLRT